MKIKSIDIKNFGRLKDFILSFEEGFNVLYGENEQGKSTIMAFLRMMFYGTAGRSGSDLSKNMRKRYTPWDGSKMSGSMEFSHEGTSYRLEKIFAATPKNDTIRLWNQTTNELEPLAEQREIGRKFLGMGEDAFEKSVFIGQIGSVINSEKDKENEIIQKLQNLASSGDETQSFHLIDSRIQAAIEKIRSRSGRIGILDRLQQEQSRLEEEKAQAIAMEERKEQTQRSYQELLDKKAREESLLEEKSLEAKDIRQYSDFQELQSLLIKSDAIGQLAKEQDKFESLLANGTSSVDPSFLEDVGKRLQDLIQWQTLFQNKQEELNEREEALRGGQPEGPKEISQEEFEVVNESTRRIRDGEERIKTMRFSLQQEEFDAKESIRIETAFHDNQTKIVEYKARIELLKLEEEQVLAVKKGQDKIRVHVGVYIAGSVFLLSFAITGFLVHPIFYIGGLLFFFVSIATWFGLAKKMKSIQDKALASAAATEAKSPPLSANLLFLQKELDALVDQQTKIETDRTDHEKGKPRSSVEIQSDIAVLQRAVEETEESVQTIQANLQAVYIRYGAGTFERFGEIYLEAQTVRNRRTDAARDIQDQRVRIGAQRKEFNAALQEFTECLRPIKYFQDMDFLELPELDRLKNIKEKLEELTQQYYAAQNSKTLLEEKKKDLADRLKTRSISAIRETVETMKAQVGTDVFSSMGPIWTEEEIRALEAEIERLKSTQNSTGITLARMKSEMTQAFQDQPELAVIEDMIKKNKELQAGYQGQHAALTLAKTQLEQSFLEMQQTFGPIVNKKTAEIFSKITNGKYQELLVSKDLNISFRDPLMNTTQEWQYLSGGTIDQIYFSLRLAISSFFADQAGGLPLFIDDAFLQYDNVRTRQGMLFLADYARTQQVQILYFTCHRHLYDQCGSEANRTDLSE